jgi:hypothetical protein
MDSGKQRRDLDVRSNHLSRAYLAAIQSAVVCSLATLIEE